MINKEDLRVGMKVKLVNKRPCHSVIGGFGVKMGAFLGKVVTIKGVHSRTITIEEDNGVHIWDYCLIEGLELFERKSRKVYKREDLRVGMKVKIQKFRPTSPVNGGFISEMEDYLGKELTINDISEGGFMVKENEWFWDYCLIEDVVGFHKDALKVGMKVRLKPIFVFDGIGGYNPSMRGLRGTVVTIKELESHGFRIEEDNGYIWDYRNIEDIVTTKVLTTNIDMLANFRDFRRIRKWLPEGADIKKIVINGLNVIVFVEAFGCIYKAKATCNPCEQFNASHGLEIAVNRATEQIAKARLRKLTA